jgi:menaquinone reductase, multiheme cytochrome c subunit
MSRNIRNSSDRQLPGGVRLHALAFILGFGCLLFIGWVAFPALLYKNTPQPLSFNHRLHTKIADDGCNSCHFFRKDGRFSGIPGIETCRTCHIKVETGGDSETRLLRDYIAKKSEIPWQVYARQPDSVFFSHAAHVRSAGLDCETCHGDIGQSAVSQNYEENVMTGYSRDMEESMKMDDCAACHEETKQDGASAQTDRDGCFICHK